jgi:hypothetical protein
MAYVFTITNISPVVSVEVSNTETVRVSSTTTSIQVNTQGILIDGGPGPIGYTGSRGSIGYVGSTGSQGIQGGANPWINIASNTLAQSNNQYSANTSGGSFTLTLPASPAVGDFVYINDAANWAVNNLTVNSNGLKLEGSVQDLILNVRGIVVICVYTGTANGWKVTSTLGAIGEKGDTGANGVGADQRFIAGFNSTSTSVSVTRGVDFTYPLSAVKFDNIGVTLSNNQITLPAGNYKVDGYIVVFVTVEKPFGGQTENVLFSLNTSTGIKSLSGTVLMQAPTVYDVIANQDGFVTTRFVPIKGTMSLSTTTSVVLNINWYSGGVPQFNPFSGSITSGIPLAELEFTKLN